MNLFSPRLRLTLLQIMKVQLRKLSFNEINKSENQLTEKELFMSLLSMQNNKSPRNDGLRRVFYNILN